MKATITSICLMIAVCVTGCKDGLKNVIPPNPTTAVSVIGDATDEIKKIPEEREVLQPFDLDNLDNIYNGVTFRFKNIENVSITDVKTYTVQPEYSLLANRNERIASLKVFRTQVKETIADARKHYHQTQNKSEVFRVVANEANYLSHCGADSRTMILYSNCLDNNSELNLYDRIVMNTVVNHPDQVMAMLEKNVVKIESLKGVKVYIVYQSLNPDDERHFLIASNFYRYVLSEHGAKVDIVPTLTVN